MDKIFKELKREEIIGNLNEEINKVNSNEEQNMSNEDKIWSSLLKITKILVRQDQLNDVYENQIIKMQDKIQELKEEIYKLKN